MKKIYIMRHKSCEEEWYSEKAQASLCSSVMWRIFGLERFWLAARITVSTKPFEGATLVGVRASYRPGAPVDVRYTFNKRAIYPRGIMFWSMSDWLIHNIKGLASPAAPVVNLYVVVKALEGHGRV